jgi:dihydroanticapsin dehydrogenase
MERLKEKVAIVTGAASGIGRAIAELFAREGARVAVSDINADGGLETAGAISRCGGEAFFFRTDVTRKEDVQKLVEAAVEAYCGIDILVNNAGLLLFGTILKMEEQDWDRMMEVNLKSVFLCSQMVTPRIIERGGGAIINVASIGGLVAGRGLAAYNASKGGVVLLTKNMALDLAHYHIRVNCVCPGMTSTPMADQIFVKWSGGDQALAERESKKGVKAYPLGRYGAPEEIAQAALFLATDDSSFMTGTCLVVDGGFTAQ